MSVPPGAEHLERWQQDEVFQGAAFPTLRRAARHAKGAPAYLSQTTFKASAAVPDRPHSRHRVQCVTDHTRGSGCMGTADRLDSSNARYFRSDSRGFHPSIREATSYGHYEDELERRGTRLCEVPVAVHLSHAQVQTFSTLNLQTFVTTVRHHILDQFAQPCFDFLCRKVVITHAKKLRFRTIEICGSYEETGAARSRAKFGNDVTQISDVPRGGLQDSKSLRALRSPSFAASSRISFPEAVLGSLAMR